MSGAISLETPRRDVSTPSYRATGCASTNSCISRPPRQSPAGLAAEHGRMRPVAHPNLPSHCVGTFDSAASGLLILMMGEEPMKE
jgi:hypothetical protein